MKSWQRRIAGVTNPESFVAGVGKESRPQDVCRHVDILAVAAEVDVEARDIAGIAAAPSPPPEFEQPER